MGLVPMGLCFGTALFRWACASACWGRLLWWSGSLFRWWFAIACADRFCELEACSDGGCLVWSFAIAGADRLCVCRRLSPMGDDGLCGSLCVSWLVLKPLFVCRGL
jgi:hypothetical protein